MTPHRPRRDFRSFVAAMVVAFFSAALIGSVVALIERLHG